jgi:hypothetical protein
VSIGVQTGGGGEEELAARIDCRTRYGRMLILAGKS